MQAAPIVHRRGRSHHLVRWVLWGKLTLKAVQATHRTRNGLTRKARPPPSKLDTIAVTNIVFEPIQSIRFIKRTGVTCQLSRLSAGRHGCAAPAADPSARSRGWTGRDELGAWAPPVHRRSSCAWMWGSLPPSRKTAPGRNTSSQPRGPSGSGRKALRIRPIDCVGVRKKRFRGFELAP